MSVRPFNTLGRRSARQRSKGDGEEATKIWTVGVKEGMGKEDRQANKLKDGSWLAGLLLLHLTFGR